MPIISRINLVEIPSEQPDTPQPMTGEALGVFEKQTFIDPPISDRKNTFFFVHLYNTRKNRVSGTGFINGRDTAYTNNGGGWVEALTNSRFSCGYLGLDFISSTLEPGDPGNPGADPIVTYSFGFGKSSAGYFIRSGFNVDSFTFPTGSDIGQLTMVPSLNTSETNKDRLLAATNSPTDTNLIPDTFQNLIWHAWGMCGKTYCLTVEGDIYTSDDGFISNKTKIGSLSDALEMSGNPKLTIGLILPRAIGW